MREHMWEMSWRREELVARVRPPETLFGSVPEEPDVWALGARLKQTYARTLKRAPTSERLDTIRRAGEEYLAHFPPGRREAALRGALVHAYPNE